MRLAAVLLAAAAVHLRAAGTRRRRLARARSRPRPRVSRGARRCAVPALAATCGACLGFADPRLSVPGAVAGAALVLVRARAAAANAAAARAAAIPLLVDLVEVAVAAGDTPARALVHAAPHAPAEARHVLAGTLSALALGVGLDAAVHAARGADAGLDAMLDTLVRGAALGSPVGPQLADLARRLRADRLRVAQARARTLPVRLLFPLVLLVLPSFVLLGVVPLLLGTAAGLHAP